MKNEKHENCQGRERQIVLLPDGWIGWGRNVTGDGLSIATDPTDCRIMLETDTGTEALPDCHQDSAPLAIRQHKNKQTVN